MSTSVRRLAATPLLILFTLSLVVAACAAPPPPTSVPTGAPPSAPTNSPAPNVPSTVTEISEPDRVATRVAEELAVAQTLTAVAKSDETPIPVAATSTAAPSQTSTLRPKNSATPRAARTSTPRTSTPRPGSSASPLDFDWRVDSAGLNPNNSDEWQAIIVVTPRGGNGKYSYFHDGLPVDGPRFPVVWRLCRSKPGSIWVQDGTGQLVKKDYFLESQYCNVTPSVTPTP